VCGEDDRVGRGVEKRVRIVAVGMREFGPVCRVRRGGNVCCDKEKMAEYPSKKDRLLCILEKKDIV